MQNIWNLDEFIWQSESFAFCNKPLYKHTEEEEGNYLGLQGMKKPLTTVLYVVVDVDKTCLISSNFSLKKYFL